jgi:peptidoglycan/LPS O-acetylase OafA/YrhL
MSQQRYPFPDFARGYAMLTVVGFHILKAFGVPDWLEGPIRFGGTGVHLFFALSGFGLGLSGTPKSKYQFYGRRIHRIWVPFCLALLVSMLVDLAFGVFQESPVKVLSGVLGLHAVLPNHVHSYGGHFWYVTTIAQLYLIFPFLMRMVERVKPAVALFAGLCCSASWWTIVATTDRVDVRTWNSASPQFLWEFVLGMVIARWLVSGEPSWVRRIRRHAGIGWWVAGGCVSTAATVALSKGGSVGRVFNDVPALAGYSMLCIACWLWLRRSGEGVLLRLVERVGGGSYGTYLVHMIPIIWIERSTRFDSLPVGARMLLAAAGVAAIGLLFGRLVAFVEASVLTRLVPRFLRDRELDRMSRQARPVASEKQKQL